jgi:hypothetical protein
MKECVGDHFQHMVLAGKFGFERDQPLVGPRADIAGYGRK